MLPAIFMASRRAMTNAAMNRGRAGPVPGGKVAQQGRSAADCAEYR
jgi:hypothetical protein